MLQCSNLSIFHITRYLVLALVMIVSAACGQVSPGQPIPEQLHSLPEDHSLVIMFEDIHLELIGHEHPTLVLSGSSSDDDVDIDVLQPQGKSITQISSEASDLPLTTLLVKIPYGRHVDIIQGSGSISVHDFDGHLSIDTISATIDLHRVQGTVRAINRRSWIRISDSHGVIDAIAEADEIQFQDVKGQVTGTNIMGKINFNGAISHGDSSRLETDHGAINVNLNQGSNVQIKSLSSGGRIVCTLPEMSGTFNSCQGVFGTGAGELWIRTVSGSIGISQLP